MADNERSAYEELASTVAAWKRYERMKRRVDRKDRAPQERDGLLRRILKRLGL